jgi:poly(3-hydroxybutyrate) depolymerase
LSIKQMVDYALSSYGLNPARVYVTGLSAGGAMTAVMLATYPDVFAAGSVVAGPSPTPSGPCFTVSNYAQVSAGRAHQSAGQTYANGSNQAMGLWNTYVKHTLRQTGTNYYVLADGQC